MRRFLVTLMAMVTLAVTFRVYSAVLSPLTAVNNAKRLLIDPLETDHPAPAIFEQQAAQVFPDVAWTHQADQTWQMGERTYLYFNKYERLPGAGNAIQISPVAIFWHDPKRPTAAPFRILATRAQLKFQNPFFDTAIALSNANPGRIVWASMEGQVHIDGPDGLSIDGQNFKFDEESSQLYSDHELQFTYGPTPLDQRRIAGSADGLQLMFAAAQESILGKDLPRVGDLAQILLRRNADLKMSFVQQDEPRQARIRSAGPLLYDVIKREVTLEDHVQGVHLTNLAGIPRKDQIDCAWLRLEFDSTVPVDPDGKRKPGSAFDGLSFHRLRAQGSDNGHGTRLKVTSDDQQLQAEMQDLAYDGTLRRAVLIDQEQVVIHRGNAKFVCPQIGFQHSPTNQIEYLECRGPGQLDMLPEKPGDPPLIASWEGHVQITPDPQSGVHQIQLQEQALLGIPEQFGIAAETIWLWADLEQAQNASKSPSPTAVRVNQTGQQQQQNILSGVLPLKRARAENHVVLDSQLLKVEHSNLIDVFIHPGLIVEDSITESATANSRATDATSNGQPASPDAERSPWILSADTLEVHLIHDSGKAAIDLRRVTGDGHVVIQRDAASTPRSTASSATPQMNGPLIAKGQSLIATNKGGLHQILTIRGEIGPNGEQMQNARVSLGDAALWGTQITLSRHENRVDVPGPGGLTVPMTQDLNGQPSQSATRMDIVWEEGMAFDGLAARFWGKVTAAVPGEQKGTTRLLCEDLEATLNQKISFATPQAQPANLNISVVEARHQVVIESFEFNQNQLAAVRNSSLSTLRVNLDSGDFDGDGPGIIESWSLGDAVKFSPGESPQANQPAKPADTRWRYSTVRFSGKIDGNMNRHDATLRERVEVLTAPVDKAKTKFQREQLSAETPEAANAVWMRCNQMRIIQKPLADQRETAFEIYATGGTELEGHAFRAVADELTYDEGYGLFTLRGLGKEAHLYHQAQPGQPVNPFSASQIKFVPVKREIVIDGSSGISGSY